MHSPNPSKEGTENHDDQSPVLAVQLVLPASHVRSLHIGHLVGVRVVHRAVPGHPWLTCPPPQDAKFDINVKDILRPHHTYKGDVLPMGGVYFLKKYTYTFWETKGEKATEEIRLFDDLKCAFPTTTKWMDISITGPPFEDSRERCTPLAHKF